MKISPLTFFICLYGSTFLFSCKQEEVSSYKCFYGDCFEVMNNSGYDSEASCILHCEGSTSENESSDEDNINSDDNSSNEETSCPTGTITVEIPSGYGYTYYSSNSPCDYYPKWTGNFYVKNECNGFGYEWSGGSRIVPGNTYTFEDVKGVSFNVDYQGTCSSNIKDLSYKWECSYAGETHYINIGDLR